MTIRVFLTEQLPSWVLYKISPKPYSNAKDAAALPVVSFVSWGFREFKRSQRKVLHEKDFKRKNEVFCARAGIGRFNRHIAVPSHRV